MKNEQTIAPPKPYVSFNSGRFLGVWETLRMSGMVEMFVQDGGEDVLYYSFSSIAEASEMLAFLKEFFPSGTFLIQPLRH